MKERIEENEVEIGFDEDGLYFEAGSEEAAYGFIAVLLRGAEGTMAFMETRVVEYEEVEMAELETGQGVGLRTNRIELIHMITDLIEVSQVKVIEDRDDASMLAISIVDGIVDGLEDEANRQKAFEVAVSSDKTVLVCPGCEATEDNIMPVTVHGELIIKCAACGHEGSLSDFRTAAAGDGDE